MKRSQIISIIVVLCAGIGVFAWVKSHKTASAPSDEEEATPTVVSVQVGALKRMTLHHYLSGYGTIEPAPAMADQPAAEAPLAAPAAGVVATVNVVPGAHINRGDLVVTLNAGGITQDYAEQELERQRKLFSEHNTSLKNLQNAEAQLAMLRVTAPLAGTVVSVNVKPGAAVDANTVVAEVIDLSRLVVRTVVPASQAHKLRPDQETQVLTAPPVTARLGYISQTVDTSNDTVVGWAALPPDSGLRPGQYVPFKIVTEIHTNCLAAPEESVVSDIDGQSVISLVNGDEATRKRVQTGLHEDGWVEVSAEGLKEGDSVVTVGAYGLPDKTKINVVKPATNAVPIPSASRPPLQ